LMDIAAAAVKQGAGESSEADEAEIPASPPARERHPAREREAMRRERRESATGAAAPARRPAKGGKGAGYAMAKLYVGGGRKLKIRPGDIVGAITNEMSLDASTIGAIQIWDRHSIVEVPETIAEEVIRTLSATTIKGKKLQIRRDRSVR
ncbi:MAG: DbpA RNA binding domain-containing protein, partial [Gemmatimonadaceae bacterium]